MRLVLATVALLTGCATVEVRDPSYLAQDGYSCCKVRGRALTCGPTHRDMRACPTPADLEAAR